MSKHLASKKITASHSSATDLAAKVIKILEKQDTIQKITLGVIKPNLKPGPHRIKIIPIQGGIRMAVRSTTSVQQLFVYGGNLENLNRVLVKKIGIPVVVGAFN